MKARQQSVTITEEVKNNLLVKTREITTSALDSNSNTSELDYTVTTERR